MFAIQHTLVSQDLLDKHFVCDLNACKGACCVKGDAGAPLEDEEISTLEDILDDVLPYMDDAGRAAVHANGVFEIDVDGDAGTTLIADGRCAFATITDQGVVTCAIERAHADGKVAFKKPVSCHLYPIRVTSLKNYEAVNYNRWDICSPACACGTKLQVPLFRFVKEALVRKYGQQWYDELEAIDAELRKQGGLS